MHNIFLVWKYFLTQNDIDRFESTELSYAPVYKCDSDSQMFSYRYKNEKLLKQSGVQYFKLLAITIKVNLQL